MAEMQSQKHCRHSVYQPSALNHQLHFRSRVRATRASFLENGDAAHVRVRESDATMRSSHPLTISTTDESRHWADHAVAPEHHIEMRHTLDHIRVSGPHVRKHMVSP